MKKHSRKVIIAKPNTEETCNCRKKDQCPLQNKCLSTNLIYNDHVETNENAQEMNYIGLTEGTFKQRYNQHNYSFRHSKHANSTELSKYVWNLKDENNEYNIKWSIITSAKAYGSGSKKCNLICLTEKYCIIKSDKPNSLNKRSN